MPIKIDDHNNIKISKGESATLKVSIIGDALSEGDAIKFAVKPNGSNPDELISKTVDNISEGTSIVNIELEPEDFESLSFSTYKYDVVRIKADRSVNYLLFPANFEVVEVIANV